jgi:hypothetical protein
MRVHCRAKHNANEQWKRVTCQRFFPSRGGSTFFEVADDRDEEADACAEPVGNESLVTLVKSGEVIARASERGSTIADGETDEANPWLRRTGWTQCLRGLDRSELMRSISEPTDDEGLTKNIWDAAGELAEAMQATVTHEAGLFMCMEAERADRARTHYRPLRPYQDQKSIRRHVRPWQQALMFFARTQVDPDLGPKYRFNAQQQAAWTSLVADASAAAVLRFCISLLDQRVAAHENESPMISALAVLGVRAEGWMTPQSFPPVLSSLIKLARFMVVEHAMRSGGDCLQSLGVMVDRFMVRGSNGPMQWMLDLRTYGLKIHFNTAREGTVRWEGDKLLHKSTELTMGELRQIIHGLVTKARRALQQQLLFTNDLPEIRWSSMRDNPADTHRDYSFLSDRRTSWAVDGPSWLEARVLSTDALSRPFLLRSGDVNVKGVAAYASRVTDFLEMLLVLMHLTGGQPARMPELLSLRHANTAQGGVRNIFVENGLIAFVTAYHKGYSMTGDVKLIHRYLPREVGELLVWYLWLVLPWATKLAAGVAGEQYRASKHLWPGKRWSSDRAGRALKREFRLATGADIGISAYREMAIAISRKYLRARFEDDDDENELDEIEDEQAGHTSHVAGMMYARGIAEQDGAVASKRERFSRASVEWHRFVGFESASRKRNCPDDQVRRIRRAAGPGPSPSPGPGPRPLLSGPH